MSVSEQERLQYEQALLELRTLQRVAEELSRSLDLDAVLGRCLDLAVEAAHGVAGAIYLHEGGGFRRVVVRGLADVVAPPFLPGDLLSGPALAGSSLQVEITADSPYPVVVEAWKGGLRRVVVLALRSDSQDLVGFLAVHFREPAPLGATLHTLEAIARQGAVAIANARAHRLLADEKRRLDAVLEHLPVVVAVIGAKGELLHVNQAGREFAASFATGLNWLQALEHIETLDRDGQPVPREDFLIMQAFQGKKPPPRELTLVGKSGKRVHVMSLAAPLFDADGRVESVVTGFQDVTSLRDLADAKDHFLRIASHELRSPLTALRATTSLLEMDPTAIQDDERRELLLSRVQRQVARLTRLVEQLIDSVRLHATEPPLDRAPTELVALCREVIETLPEGNRVTLDAPVPVEGLWDPMRLEQVLSNLLSNAVRYSPEGPPIVLRVRSDGKQALLQVTDRGIGIPPEQIDNLFTPFFRARNASLQSKGGLGLGLHIAHEIVHRHGGTLTVESKLGEGSTFTATLPL
jgi:PAS domain S-box-containing protein